VRVDPAAFAAKNLVSAKEPRFVVKIEYAAVSLYISSHSDISGVPATHIAGALIEPSISSQKLNPDQGRAEIGAASFTVADLNTEFSDNVRALNAAGENLRDKIVRFYLGYAGLAFSDFQLVGTQIVKDVSFDKGAFRVSCNDIQRSARKDIFDLAGTTLASTVEVADTTINVSATAGFTTVEHGTSYTDAASSTVGYIKIKDEVIRYTGKTSTSFTGCTRGVLGTQAARYVVDGGTPSARREKVSEYVYLEMPAPKLAYAILTGVLHGQGGDTLPATWHLGIPTSLVRLADFTGIGTDLWDTTDDTQGVVLRFEGLTKADGKAFLETEVCKLVGLFMPVYTTGELGLRRMTRVLSDAAGVVTLDESNSVQVGDLEHDFDSLHNSFQIDWNWNGKDYTRRTVYVDTASVAKHGKSTTMSLKFKGLFGGRHTDAMLFKLLDSIRDRFSAPPVRLRVDVFHSLNALEVGDVVRVKHRCLRDYTGSGDTIDRAMEVQSATVNWRTGAVSLELFGSTETASIISPTLATSALPDAFYTAQGTNLTTVATITGGVMATGSYTLAGGTDATAAGSTWYYNGDLTIPAGCTLNISGNVQIRVKGYLTINGTITGIGGGLTGVADNGLGTPVLGGNSGFVGNSRGHDGISRYNLDRGSVQIQTHPCKMTQGKNASCPFFDLSVSGNTLKGLPTDLRGTGGAPGGKIVGLDRTFYYANGGSGGNGGAGLITVSRGFGFGANGTINLSGANTTAPAYYTWTEEWRHIRVFPGAGGSGGPGTYLLLIDGGLLSVPDLAGRYVSKAGDLIPGAYETALGGTDVEDLNWTGEPFAGWLDNPETIDNVDMSFSASRIQYIPAPETATQDTVTIAPVTALSISQGSQGYAVSFTAPDGAPVGTVYEVWEHTSSTPFASATKKAEGATTAFFIPRADTTTVYVWVRAKVKNAAGAFVYSATTPTTTGIAAGAIANAGTYASASPTTASASATNSSLTTNSVTVSLTGATATTWSWAKQSGDTFTVTNGSAASTTFSITGVGVGVTKSAIYRCTVNGTYTVDVAVSATNTGAALSVSASPTTVSTTASGATVTTGTVTATAAGGSGGTTYAWTKVTGGSITATSASSAATTFSGATMTAGESRTATFRCTATDSSAATATVDVSVTVTRTTTLTVTLSPTVINKIGSTSSITSASVTATPSGGTAPYTHAWTKQSGDSITINSASSSVTSFTAASMFEGNSRTAVFRDTVTDANSITGTADITVTIERNSNP
jgi:hypothetical protein